jgi:predicted metalloprotease
MTILQSVLSDGASSAPAESGPAEVNPEEDALAEFVSLVLGDTEATWPALMRAQVNQEYVPPTLVLFTDEVHSACGMQSAAVGPFYCPADQKVYIDLGFYSQLSQRFGAPGDFAQAYVIAHEVGHHIQNLLGTSTRIHRQQQGMSEEAANDLSVRLELQADCYAGVWAHHAERSRDVLEAGDVEEGLRAAAAIGDDTLQRNAGRAVSPESFTHGSSDQRVRWFRVGMDHGDMTRCDTFNARSL